MSNKEEDSTGLFGFLRLYFAEFWRYMVTGMLVWVPLMITAWVTWFFIERFILGTENLIRNGIGWIHRTTYGTILEWTVYFNYYPGMGALVVVALFLTTGFLTRFIVGRRIISIGERIVDQIPLISRVYRSVQQIRDTFIGRKGAVFQNVAIVEYPRAGMYAVAFVTSTEKGIVQNTVGKELHAVFVPTTPNPTSGYLVYLPPDDIRIIDVTVEEAMKLIVSGGAYIPGGENEDEESVESERKESAPEDDADSQRA